MDSVAHESRRLFDSACNGHFLVNLTGNRYLSIELTEQLKLLGAGKSNEGRGIGNDDHEQRRSSVKNSQVLPGNLLSVIGCAT